MFYYFYIVVLALLAFIAFVFNIDLDMNHSLQLILMFIGIFGTFGGAYLGAKVAGEYSIKASERKHELEIKKYKKKAEYIKSSYYKQAVRLINNMRPQDFYSTVTIKIGDNDLALGPVFKEAKYIPLDSYTLDKISNMVEKLNEFRLSDGYFYLKDSEIRDMDEMIILLEDVTDLFMSLNRYNKKGLSEGDDAFDRIKDKAFEKLENLYLLDSSNKQIHLQKRDN